MSHTPEQKPRILLIHNYYQIPGGEDTVVANEKRLLEDHGHRVILYTRHNSEITQMSEWKKLLLPLMTIFNPRSSRDVRQIIREHKIDIVHVHNTLNLISPSVYYAARKCGVPVVQTVHNFRLICPGAMLYRDGHLCEDCVSKGLGCAVRHGCYRGSKAQTLITVISVLLHRATGIYGSLYYICLTAFNREKLLEINRKKTLIASSRVFVKPNFTFSDAVFQPAGEQQDRGFLYVGRLDERKGIQVLLEAWRSMGKDAPRLTVCGTGPLEAALQDGIAGLPVTWKGFVTHEEAEGLIAQSRAIILPTLLYEGFPMTIAEAFSVGTPVICSDLGNCGALIEEGVTGWKCQPGSAEDLVRAVQKCLCADGTIRDNVRRVYENNYTPEANYRRLSEIYTEVRHAHRSFGVKRRKFRQ